MNKLDLLLKIDKKKLVMPEVQIEVKRLSDILGEPFIITCTALTFDDFAELQKGEAANERILLKGIKDPDFGNMKVIEHFGCTSAKEVINTLFLPGEVANIADKITELSGFKDDMVKQIKKQ